MSLAAAVKTKKIKWQDIFISDDKKAGYVGVTSKADGFQIKRWYGANDYDRITRETAGLVDQYITVNAFRLENFNKFSRKTENLKQIRNIAIDIDQYNVDMNYTEVLEALQELVNAKEIPAPNMILTSRGTQLFYTIQGGASTKVAWLASYITEQLIYKLEKYGADPQAKDLSRVMRVPYSVNSRNNATVIPHYWRDEGYSLQELQQYVKPLNEFTGRTRKRHSNVTDIDPGLLRYYRTNHARLRDLEKLVEIRQGNMTGVRNTFFYIYAFHKSLILSTQDDVLRACEVLAGQMYTTDTKATDKRMKWLKSTVKSAYKDSKAFFEHYKANNYTVRYANTDGIKKPYKTENVIDKLNITADELEHLTSITTPQVKRKNKAKHNKHTRLDKGIHKQTRADYEAERKQQREANEQRAMELKKQGYKQREIADVTGFSKGFISQIIKKFTGA